MLMAGCAHEAARPLSVQAAPTAARTLEDPAVRAVLATIAVEPAQSPGTLTGSEAFAAALTFSPQLSLQRAQLALARADVMRAQQRPNPLLTLSPEKLISTAADGVSPWIVALSLVWPARTAGKRKLEIEQALAMNDAALLAAANAVWQLRASVRGALCSAELAHTRNRLVQEEAALREDLAARLVKQADAGVVSRYDALRAQLESAQTAQRLRQSEAELHTARFDLADAMGVPAAELARRQLGATCAPSAAPPPALDALQESAVAARLDLRARLAEFRAVDASFRTELARRFPDLTLGPGYTYDQGDRRITFTLTAELPVFSRNGAAIARARAERDRVIAEIDQLQWSVRADLERALDQLALARQQFADAESLTQRADEIVARDRERLHAGELDQPAVILSQIAALTARADALSVKRMWVDATASLEAATQTPLGPPYFDGAAATRLFAPATHTEPP
jgi:outer membrane protein, heavy metal efflux system